MDNLDGTVRGHDVNAIWFSAREFEIAIADPRIERDILHFESALVLAALAVAGAGAGQPDLRLYIEKNRDFRTPVPAYEVGQLLDELNGNTAAVTLVRHRRVVETIADDEFAFVEGRFDLLQDVLAARCIEEKQFRCCSEVDRFRMKEDFSNAFADGGPARLTRDAVSDPA